jgi:hypothetical protein
MGQGTVTISIDVELAWGNWDNLRQMHANHIHHSERPIIERLMMLFDRYDIRVTWAIVAALLDPASARGRPGPERLWYAPDVIDTIVSARVPHELGSHGGRHAYFDLMPEEEANDDLDFARSIHERNGLMFQSFVFPRNQVNYTHLLVKHGLHVYRGADQAWHQRLREFNLLLGRGANLIDKFLPIPPETVEPRREGALVNLPGSMLFLGRSGVRKFLAPAVMRSKLRGGLQKAVSEQRVFHLWFHPSNFWHETEQQFLVFEAFLQELGRSIADGRVSAAPLAAYACQ